jgi:hypothetical protein
MIEGKKYSVIYADPHWKFSVYSPKGRDEALPPTLSNYLQSFTPRLG